MSIKNVFVLLLLLVIIYALVVSADKSELKNNVSIPSSQLLNNNPTVTKTDADKIVGKWVMHDTGAKNRGYETSYTFNKDGTGNTENWVFGKRFFKYRLFQNRIILSDIKPCSAEEGYPCNADGDIFNLLQKKYEFYDDDNLIISGTLFERSWTLW